MSLTALVWSMHLHVWILYSICKYSLQVMAWFHLSSWGLIAAILCCPWAPLCTLFPCFWISSVFWQVHMERTSWLVKVREHHYSALSVIVKSVTMVIGDNHKPFYVWLFLVWKCISPHNLTLGVVTSLYMDRAADRGMLILIWQLSPSQSFLAHSAMKHNGVCMVISCAHLNRILDTGMFSLRQHYSITIHRIDGHLSMENIQIRHA